MFSQKIPFIKTGRDSSLGYVADPLNFNAIWGCEVLMRSSSDLSAYQWGWSAKDLADEIINRQLPFLETIHGLAIGEGNKCTFSLRFIQHKPGEPMCIYFLIRISSKSVEEARWVSENMWFQISSIFPFDYVITPLLEESDLWVAINPFQNNECNQGAVVFPYIGPIGRNSRRNVRTDRYLVSNWVTTPTSHENIWRAINHDQSTVMVEFLYEPIIPSWKEQKLLYELSGAVNSRNKTKNRALEIEKYFLVQVRIVSIEDVIPLSKIISIALTSSNVLNDSIRSLAKIEKLKDVNRVFQMKFVPVMGAKNLNLRRLPFFATISETHAIIRLPILPKGSIPGLKVKISEEKNNVT